MCLKSQTESWSNNCMNTLTHIYTHLKRTQVEKTLRFVRMGWEVYTWRVCQSMWCEIQKGWWLCWGKGPTSEQQPPQRWTRYTSWADKHGCFRHRLLAKIIELHGKNVRRNGVINCKIDVTNSISAEKSQSMKLTRLHSPSWCLALLCSFVQQLKSVLFKVRDSCQQMNCIPLHCIFHCRRAVVAMQCSLLLWNMRSMTALGGV